MSTTARLCAAVIASLFTLTIVGCNTISGIGQDVSAGGKALTHSADKTQTDLDTSNKS